MTALVFDFVPVWTLILGVGVFLYVLLDGFDLGVGILYGFAPDRDARNLVMNSIAPIWDGNETWLVLGGLALLAAFPLAFAIILPAVYFPLLIMLLSLIFRGVAFEFRYRDAEHRTFWDHAFSYGSRLGAFAQGVVLGAFIEGFEIDGRHFAGSSVDCFTPFTFLTGVALVFGYALLGAGWLILKTEGPLQDWARRLGRFAFIGVLAAIAVVSLWTPMLQPSIASRWFSWPNVALLSPVPIATAVIAYWEWRSLNDRSEAAPFVGAILLFVMSYLGIAISMWPMIVPYKYTLWEAASSEATQAFLAVGTLFLLPVILMYTAWSYWVFRGKVRADIGYH
ncbi:MAG: cytochrome d ubiquinol oxidase subunit II [Roseiarcus sp.]|jgi:cytochrome bd ubiquinol oxidase subunit II|uniref:cytochrome d ubiquinol oxidase subunit II n=1 Tax=Roseiarcus sp. TaxID=1969460 RepID=UPI003C552800